MTTQKLVESHGRRRVRYAWGNGKNLGLAKTRIETWDEVCARFVDGAGENRFGLETMAEYDAMSQDEQAALKRAGGFFFGAATVDGHRKRGNLQPRTLITLDADSILPETVDLLEMGVHDACAHELAAFPTRGSRPSKPRYRIILLSAEQISEDSYEPVSRIVTFMLFREDGFAQFDKVSYRPNQLHYWPSRSSDQPFNPIINHGKLVKPSEIMAEWGRRYHDDENAWKDPTKWPRLDGEKAWRDPKIKTVDPRTKPGLIGAWNRIYSIYEVIDKFLSHIYAPVDGQTGKTRYTYILGRSSAGAEVQDDGLFLYSHHGSDPAGDRLLNSFDLARLHLYRHLDAGLPDEDGEDAGPITKRPSYKAMLAQAWNDLEVLNEAGETPVDDRFDDSDVGADELESPAEPAATGPTFDPDIEELLGPPGGTGKLPEKELGWIDQMNRDHAITVLGGKTVIINTSGKVVSYSTQADLRLRYANRPIQKSNGSWSTWGEVWLEHPRRRQYLGGVVYSPELDVPGMFNLWRGWAIEAKQGSCQLFLDHVLYVICRGNRTHYEWVMRYLAHMVQKPREKPGTALVFKGLKGTGKDTVGQYIGKLLGRSRVKISQASHLTGNFNVHLQHALLLHVEEAIWAGNRDAQGPLKSLISSVEIMIEQKGIDAFPVETYFRMVMTSNERWVVPATDHERRFAVFEVAERFARLSSSGKAGELESKTYFDRLYAEMEGEGPAALLYLLQKWDLSDFNPRKPPNTSALSEQKLQTLRGPERWWYDILSTGIMPVSYEPTLGRAKEQDWATEPVVVPLIVLHENIIEWTRQTKYEGIAPALNALGKELLKLTKGLVHLGNHKLGGKQTSVRVFPSLDACRQAFKEHIGADELEWEPAAPVSDGSEFT